MIPHDRKRGLARNPANTRRSVLAKTGRGWDKSRGRVVVAIGHLQGAGLETQG
jgi:hypothetical protein